MPWAWVVAGLAVWTIAALLVIAFCISVRQIDARLARDRTTAGSAMEDKLRPGAAVDVEQAA